MTTERLYCLYCGIALDAAGGCERCKPSANNFGGNSPIARANDQDVADMLEIENLKRRNEELLAALRAIASGQPEATATPFTAEYARRIAGAALAGKDAP